MKQPTKLKNFGLALVILMLICGIILLFTKTTYAPFLYVFIFISLLSVGVFMRIDRINRARARKMDD